MSEARANCPFCGDEEGAVTMDLNDIGSCKCEECGEEYTVEEALKRAMEQAARWEEVCEWVAKARKNGGGEGR